MMERKDLIEALLKRKKEITAQDVINQISCSSARAGKILKGLQDEGRIEKIRIGNKVTYRLLESTNRSIVEPNRSIVEPNRSIANEDRSIVEEIEIYQNQIWNGYICEMRCTYGLGSDECLCDGDYCPWMKHRSTGKYVQTNISKSEPKKPSLSYEAGLSRIFNRENYKSSNASQDVFVGINLDD